MFSSVTHSVSRFTYSAQGTRNNCHSKYALNFRRGCSHCPRLSAVEGDRDSSEPSGLSMFGGETPNIRQEEGWSIPAIHSKHFLERQRRRSRTVGRRTRSTARRAQYLVGRMERRTPSSHA